MLSLEYIKVGLEINGEEYGPFNLGEEKGIIDSGVIYKKEIINYKLRIWLDKEKEEEIEEAEGKRANLKIVVEAKQFLGNLDKSGANEPVLASSMIPVYYDEEEGIWKKADSTNTNYKHKWYNYNEKMWANSVTYDHSKVYNFNSESTNRYGNVKDLIYEDDGMTFNGTSSYIDTNIKDTAVQNTITIGVRLKIQEPDGSNNAIVSSSDTSTSGFGVSTGATTTSIGITIYNTTSTTLWTSRLEIGKWYNVVFTYDGSNLKSYINGKLDKTVTTTKKLTSTGNNIYVGARPYESSPRYFNGSISDIFVSNEVYSESKIQTNYTKIEYNNGDDIEFYYNLRSYENSLNIGEEIPMEMISTMQVWVPRYKYKVWNYNADGTKTSDPQEIEIIFEEGTETTGEIECTDTISGTDGAKSESCKINNTECTDDTCNNKYYTHPAFTFGEEEIEGFWIGKFELTGSIDNITTKPNLTSLRNQTVSSFATNIMAMNDEGNIYGLSTTTDTHMIKNMEWGAVSYLSHSKYGTCTNGTCHEVGINNNSEFITGCGAEAGSSESTTCNSYETELGQNASTTGNIYGVYDMSGGSYNYVMGNMVSSDGTTMISGALDSSNSGYTGIVYDSGNYAQYTGLEYPDSKYYDKYSFSISSSRIKVRSKLGDAIKEVYVASITSWYDDTSYMNYARYPWIVRGDVYSGAINSGIFRSGNSTGRYGQQHSTYLILTIVS